MTNTVHLLPILMLYLVTSSRAVTPCELRVYLARAEQTDENGLKCWDTVKVPACGGRCDSREIEMTNTVHLLPILMLYLVTSSRAVTPCELRVYLARAEQTDENGLKCWDTVKVPACGGRCDSREISDWEFPFKKSHHPVCVYGGRRPLVVRLRHCDYGVAAGTDLFHFVAADDCRCKVCSSQYTSCEWLPPNSTLLAGIYDEIDDLGNF